MKQVIKYDLNLLMNRIEMPAFSEVLDVLVQGVRPFLYVLGDNDAVPVVRWFVAVKTGQKIPDGPRVKYIGSFVCDGEYTSVALHVFEVEGSCKPEDFC
jgi:hypothetical protein